MSGNEDRQRSSTDRQPLGRTLVLSSELGMAMGIMAVIMLLGSLAIGRWLDRRLDSSPWLTLIALLAAAVSSQLVLYRMAIGSAAQLGSGAQHAVSPDGLKRSAGFALCALSCAAGPPMLGAIAGLLLDRLLGTLILMTSLLTIGGSAVSVVLILRLLRLRRNQTTGE